ncbi:MAG: hypothetical protein EPN69_10535 [Rhodanobacter sp.]|nr:MAG: hypothetical protein EPN69_10535 [Rhodanobacter sp.]TAM38290.1 MAG: hypothetical protein EPN58_17310 [Rhodanobacter sp.]TAN28877.1 MAG: hypothetical protein EPN32_01760 [Rhodanobacter sp.]
MEFDSVGSSRASDSPKHAILTRQRIAPPVPERLHLRPEATITIMTVVTARSEQVSFRVPVRTGQLVELVASVVKVGRSSIHVEVEMTAEDLLSGDRRVCTSGHFVMIALDSSGAPTLVPQLSSAAT